MAQKEMKNKIISKVVTPIMEKASVQKSFEEAYKEGKISYEDIQFPLKDYLNSLDSNSKREALYCIKFYNELVKDTIKYIEGDLDKHEGTLTDSEYLDKIDSDLIDVECYIDNKEKYESNENAGTPRTIQETYGFPRDFIDEKLNHSKIAKAIKNNDPNVAAAISAGAITIVPNKTRKFKVSIKEENE